MLTHRVSVTVANFASYTALVEQLERIFTHNFCGLSSPGLLFPEAKSMFDKARVSKEARRHIW